MPIWEETLMIEDPRPSGNLFTIQEPAISWSVKKQQIVAFSSCEAEYLHVAIAGNVVEEPAIEVH